MKLTMQGTGTGRTILVDGTPRFNLTQVGWRWSRHWHVFRFKDDPTSLALGQFVGEGKTIKDALNVVRAALD